MTYRYSDIPVHHPLDSYLSAIDRMTKKLMDTGLVSCIYQVGGVSTPGISDVDLYVVFRNNISYTANPVAGLPEPDQYFFIHRLFGTSENHARRMEPLTMFGSYKHLAGEPFAMFQSVTGEKDTAILKHQIALEYLLKAWISITVSIHQGVIKLRSLLLHSKAIVYDIAFLELENTELTSCINDLMEVRNNWFTKPPSRHRLDELVDRYRKGLEAAIRDALGRYTFYHARHSGVTIGKNITLSQGDLLKHRFRGIRIPAFVSSWSKFTARLSQRFGTHAFHIPMSDSGAPGILQERQQWLSQAIMYNEKHLPGFLCTAYAMNTFH